MGFTRQEYWSVLPFPPLGDLPDPGIDPASPSSPELAGGFSTTKPLGKPSYKLSTGYFQDDWFWNSQKLKLGWVSCVDWVMLIKVQTSSLVPTLDFRNFLNVNILPRVWTHRQKFQVRSRLKWSLSKFWETCFFLVDIILFHFTQLSYNLATPVGQMLNNSGISWSSTSKAITKTRRQIPIQIGLTLQQNYWKTDKIFPFLLLIWASLVAQTIKNLPAMWKIWVRSLGWENPVGEGTAI